MTVGISRLANIVVFACYGVITKLIVELMCSLDTRTMYRMILYDVPYILCGVRNTFVSRNALETDGQS